MRKLLFGILVSVLVLLPLTIVEAETPTGINLGHDYTFQLVTGDLTSTYQ